MSTRENASPEYVPAPLPIQVGGAKIENDSRISGPPARMLPTLRDLATATVNLHPRMGGEVKPRVTIEVDLEGGRKVGVIRHYSTAQDQEVLYLAPVDKPYTPPARCQRVSLHHVLAFRVLKLEIPAPPTIHAAA